MKLENFRGELLENEPLSDHTSFRIGGRADVLAYPVDRQDLLVLLKEVKARRLSFMVIGGGTNLLVRDKGYRGVMISLKRMDAVSVVREYRSLGGSFAVVSADAGAPLARLMNFAVERGLTGLEFAAGIPGSLGGAVCMNAGTSLGDIGGVIDTVTLIDPSGELLSRPRDEMGFGYRTANVAAGEVVLDCTVILRHDDTGKVKKRVSDLMTQRKQHQPWGMPSAGSVFKNPMDEAAGRFIESAGLKGKTVGKAQVSEKHANFIVNLGGATAADVLALMEIIQAKVLAMHNVRLEPEIKIVGEE